MSHQNGPPILTPEKPLPYYNTFFKLENKKRNFLFKTYKPLAPSKIATAKRIAELEQQTKQIKPMRETIRKLTEEQTSLLVCLDFYKERDRLHRMEKLTKHFFIYCPPSSYCNRKHFIIEKKISFIRKERDH
jgi:hypothetical protein